MIHDNDYDYDDDDGFDGENDDRIIVGIYFSNCVIRDEWIVLAAGFIQMAQDVELKKMLLKWHPKISIAFLLSSWDSWAALLNIWWEDVGSIGFNSVSVFFLQEEAFFLESCSIMCSRIRNGYGHSAQENVGSFVHGKNASEKTCVCVTSLWNDQHLS